ncbi:MAG TPA: PilZ domain-containing protein [Terriglobales bacterium]|nr:PilZ domain-containing protein [Terriglobales bacterium]
MSYSEQYGGGRSGSVAEEKDKRRHPRSRAWCPVELRLTHQKHGIKGEITDLSLSGFYFDTMQPFPVETGLVVRLSLGDVVLESEAVVRTSHTNLGNGIEFVSLSDAGREELSRFLDGVEKSGH